MSKLMIPSEAEARASHSCPSCGDSKEVGALVCWHCFKYRKVLPGGALKYSGLSFEAWMRTRWGESEAKP